MLTVPLSERAQALLTMPAPQETLTDAPIPAAVREAASNALARGETHYTDRPGILPLREKVAATLKERYSLATNAKSSLVITCGVTEARFVAVQELLKPGETILCLGDEAKLEGAVTLRGGTLIKGADADEEMAFSGLYLDSTIDKATGERWLSLAASRGLWVIFEVADEGSSFHPAHTAGLEGATITIGAIGQAQGLESWRVGYLAAPDTRAAALRDFKQTLTICTTNLSQWGALALWGAE